MRRPHGYHVLFAVSLVTMTALGTWWMVFFLRTIDAERQEKLEELRLTAWNVAMSVGHGSSAPELGAVPGKPGLEVVPREAARADGTFFFTAPHFLRTGVQPSADAIAEVQRKFERRRTMVVGESGLLLLLLGVCTFMLFQMVRQERRLLRDMTSFVATISHEMKTPLAGIKSMLQTFLAGKVPADQAPILYGMGLKESDRLEHMLENVLLSGQLRTRQHELTPTPIPLRSLLEAFVEHRRQTLVGQPDEIRLAWDPEPVELLVSADRQALQVVLENLCDNAMKYGGDPAVATVGVSKGTGRVSVSVEDDGIGFEPDQAARLFEPFRRGLEGRREVQHGTGLGLAISAALVNRMGGTLTAYSEGPGCGSRFTVTLAEAKS